MAEKTFNVSIEGYWRDVNKSGIPNHSGVYFVYEAKYNESEGTVSLLKLIYIGESDKVRDRIADHERYNDWLKHVRKGNTLCFSTGPVESDYRERVEAAYIFEHKPPENVEYKYTFPFDKTIVISKGDTELLNTNFTVYRTN